MELKDMCREVRRIKRLTQRKLAELIGSNQTEISFIERGFIPTDTTKIDRIKELYNLTPPEK